MANVGERHWGEEGRAVSAAASAVAPAAAGGTSGLRTGMTGWKPVDSAADEVAAVSDEGGP